MFAVSLALVAQEFPSGPERGMAMGIYGASIGIAVAIGPLVGGLLTDGFGWQSVFLLNVPIGLAAIAVTYWKLAESPRPRRDPDRLGRPAHLLDGAVRAGAGAGARQRRGLGQRPDRLLLVAAAALLMAAFVAIEQRVAEPMLPLSLFRRRASPASSWRPSRSPARCSRCSST